MSLFLPTCCNVSTTVYLRATDFGEQQHVLGITDSNAEQGGASTKCLARTRDRAAAPGGQGVEAAPPSAASPQGTAAPPSAPSSRAKRSLCPLLGAAPVSLSFISRRCVCVCVCGPGSVAVQTSPSPSPSSPPLHCYFPRTILCFAAATATTENLSTN